MVPAATSPPSRSSRISLRSLVGTLLVFVVLSLVYTYPMVLAPTESNRLDSPDALLNCWVLSWDLYQLRRDPLHVFDANIFYPETGSLAYSENLLTGALLVSPAALVTQDPVFLYNLALILAFATSGLAAYQLAWFVTGNRLASLLAGILFAFAPYRFAHLPHLQLQLAFGIPASLYFLLRLAEDRHGRAWAVAGLALSFVATFGSSIYYTVYLATVLPLVAGLQLVYLKPPARRRAVSSWAAAALAALMILVPLALPYLAKLRSGSARSLEAAVDFSAGATEYVSSFSRVHAFLPKAAEPLFPGFVAVGLAMWALWASRHNLEKARQRWLWFLVGATGVLLSLGPAFGLFSLLYRFVPFYKAVRVPSRAGILFLMAIAILAAMGLARIRSRRIQWALVGLAALECFGGPLPLQPQRPTTPPIYDVVEALGTSGERGALVELPLPAPTQFQDNAVYVYRSAYHRLPLVNGYSGFVPPSYRRAHRLLMRDDFAMGVKTLAKEGLRFVLAHHGRLGPRMRRQLDQAHREGLLITVGEAGTDHLYEIRLDSSSAGRSP